VKSSLCLLQGRMRFMGRVFWRLWARRLAGGTCT